MSAVLPGLPGEIADTYLILPAGLSDKRIAETLRIIGRIGRASPWWAADALVYAEDHLPEGKFSQIVEELGWAPQTVMNALWVGRAWERSRRREELSFAHHAELTKLDPEDQDHWLDKAVEGDLLPNGERKRWSVSTLREKLRALDHGRLSDPAGSSTLSTGKKSVNGVEPASESPLPPARPALPESTAASASAASPEPVDGEFPVPELHRGRVVDVDGIRCRVQHVALGIEAVVLTCTRE